MKTLLIVVLTIFVVTFAAPPPAEAFVVLVPAAAVVIWAVSIAGGSILALNDVETTTDQPSTVELADRTPPAETVTDTSLARTEQIVTLETDATRLQAQ